MDSPLHPALADALQQRNFSDISRLMDQAELQSESSDPLRNWPHALHLLALVYNNSLEDARFLWKRIPADVKQAAPELQAAFRLLQCLWNMHYEATWESLRAFEWSPEVAPLVEALAARLQAETLQLLGQAYVCIHPSKAASLLGVSEQAATSLALQQGWEVDAASNMIMVHRKRAADAPWEGAGGLKQLSEYMIHLEQ